MSHRLGLTLGVLLAAAAFARAGEEAKPCEHCRRVAVFDAGTKPTAALQKAKYEWRCSQPCQGDKKCAACLKGNADPLLCAACWAKKHKDAGTKPSVAAGKRGEAFVCEDCGKLCWKDAGADKHFDEKTEGSECAACDTVKKQLKALQERKMCPHCAEQPLETGTKATAAQNLRRACPVCEKSMDGKVCKTCQDAGIKCACCEAALKLKREEQKKKDEAEKEAKDKAEKEKKEKEKEKEKEKKTKEEKEKKK